MVPFSTDRSEWHTPVASIFTLTSPAPTSTSSMSSRTSTLSSPMLRTSAARNAHPPGWFPNWNTFYSDAPSDAKPRGCSAMSGFYKYAEDEPGFVAVVEPDGTEVRAGDLLARANQYVHLLRSLGLEKGDSVAAVLPNGVKPVEVYLAALQAGWYYVPINYRLSAPEIAYIIQDSGAKAVVSDERYAEVISAAAEEAGVPSDARLAHGPVPGFQ